MRSRSGPSPTRSDAVFPPWPAARLAVRHPAPTPSNASIPLPRARTAVRNDSAPVHPDSTPTFGYLDDALLLELAWPVFAEDVDDYRDFCEFREEGRERLGRSPHQLDWLRARAEEGALWEHMHRVHDQLYVEHRAWSR